MHSPFSLSTLIPPEALGSDAVTATLLHANRVILGTEKGSLLVFDLSNASTSISPPSATLVSKHEGFCKKAVDQLGVIKELNGLLCLSGGDLTLHSLPTFALLSSFSAQSRGAASLFALSTYIHQPPAAPPRRSNTSRAAPMAPSSPEIRTTLALACRRRLVLLAWIDGAWQTPSELALPHQIRGMAFDERKIVAGFSTGEYGIITLPAAKAAASEAPSLGELFTPTMPAVEKAKAIPAGLGGLGNVMGLGALGGLSLGAKKLEKNGVVAVPRAGKGKAKDDGGKSSDGATSGAWLWGKEWGWEDEEKEKETKEGEVLVVRENIAIPLTSSGKPRTSTPSSIIYPSFTDETLVVSPYIISLLAAPPPSLAPGSSSSSTSLSPSLAIHNIDTLAPVQTLAVPPPPISPPSSIAEGSDLKLPDPAAQQPFTARLLTVASSSAQPPLLLLTSRPPPGSASAAAAAPVEQTLWIVTMKSWQSQIEELGQAGAWEEGIRLVRRSGANGGMDLPPPLLRRLAVLHSLALFTEHRYDLAIDAFISLDITPSKVVSLYPHAISGKLHIEHAGHEELFGGRPQHKVAAAIEDEIMRKHEAEEEEKKRIEEEKKKAPASPARKGKVAAAVDDDDASSIRSGIGRLKGKASWIKDSSDVLEQIADRAAIDAERQAKLDAKRYATSVDELIRYLTDRRQKYAQALATLLPSARPAPSSPRARASGAELLELPDEPLTNLSPDQLARVAQVVDTALFKAYLATKPVMVGPLCRIDNWCEVEEVEELLLAAKKYQELLDLYNGKNMHEKAVKLLRQMADDEEDPEEKVGPTIRYLQKLGADHVTVIFESSRWVFEADRAAALEIFIADLEEVESLPRHATMAHLERIGSDVCITYLEHIIHTLGEEGSEFHEKLIELYLAAVHRPNGSGSDEAYQKLLDLLESSTSYRADRMLGRLPSEDMHEVRAILLGRLGRHEGALQIYVYQLEDHATAEEYCKRVYDSDASMRPTIFHLLLRIYLRPRPSHPLLFGPALSLISSHASSIDAIEVFDLLPPLVALGDIRVFLEKTLRRSGERVREGKVVRSIGRAEVDEEEGQLVDLEERRVKITEGRVCPQCHKRLGNSVIAIHSPRGEVTHYQCREKFQEMNS
ncbi:hypothetical protein BCR35DRAFT_308965 [Leucosporidium creatinivorum]|uniref:CNH domain-containing protein n=1 Tax=Leucosporidium creatinivorum TaxID=106004 RepID=A0A1Y2DU79_9BASI|nr:hypothetical protein BCR35DRAFT_308965 [Leucosporidium creatinivorum]